MDVKNKNPWLALSTYEEKDEYRFKGRETDTENVVTMLRQNDYIVCYAASGDGKSSLINAGVCPKIRKEGMFPVKIIFTTDEYEGRNLPMIDEHQVDFDKLISSKIDQVIAEYSQVFIEKYPYAQEGISFTPLDKYDSKYSASLWWKLRTQTIQIPFGEFDYIPVLIFDQFEEIFRAKWKADFFKWLEGLSKDTCPDELHKDLTDSASEIPGRKLFKIIFSLRYEYVGELDYWCSQKTFIPQIMQNRYFLRPLTTEQAMAVIKDQDLTDETSQKLADCADVIVDNILAGSERDDSFDEVSTVALSLICYVLYEEWDENRELQFNAPTVNSLIYSYYLSQLTKIGIDENNRLILEDTLISSQNTRLRVAVSDSRLQDMGIRKFIESEDVNLISSRILREIIVNGDAYVEFIHDKLVDSISENKSVILLNRKKGIRAKQFKYEIFAILSVILLAVFMFITNKSLTWEYDEYSIASAEPQMDCVITDRSDMFLPYNDATSLKMKNGTYNTCKSRIGCYGNVAWWISEEYYAYASAGEAQTLIYAYGAFDYSVKGGHSTNRIIILCPQKIKSINCDNKHTRVFVPFGSLDTCIALDAFDGVPIQEMSLIRTFYERLRFEMYFQHLHWFGMEIPGWSVTMLIYVLSLMICLIRRSTLYVIRQRKILFVISSLTLSIVLIIFNLVLTWWVLIPVSLGLPIIAVCIVVSCLKCSSQRKREHNVRKQGAGEKSRNKYRYCIIYSSAHGKKCAFKLKNSLIDSGISLMDINLDTSLVRQDYFDLNQSYKSVLSAKRVIVIFTPEDFQNNKKNEEYWNLLNYGSNRLMYPVIFGVESIDNVNLLGPSYKALGFLYSKRGSNRAFPPIIISQNNVTRANTTELLKKLRERSTPYSRFVIKITLLPLFVMYLVMIKK